MPESDLQLDIFGNEIPIEAVIVPHPDAPPEGEPGDYVHTLGDAQIQTDDEWPEDFF